VSIKDHEQKVNKAPTAPDNCHSCRVNDREEIWQSTVARKHDDAISCHGHYYHVHDFVLIRRPIDKKRGLYGPADIGYIVKVILLGLAEPVFVIRRVGRMNEVSLLPKSMNRDEVRLSFNLRQVSLMFNAQCHRNIYSLRMKSHECL